MRWGFSVPAGGTQTLEWAVRTPDASGSYSVPVVVKQTYGSTTVDVGSYPIAITVKGLDTQGAKVIADLQALALASSSSRTARDAAVAKLQEAQSLIAAAIDAIAADLAAQFRRDIKRNLYAAVNPSPAQQVQMFTLIGNTGSLLEAAVWELLLGKPLCTGASTAKVLSAANEQRIPVYLVDSTNAGAIVTSLQISADAKQEISNAVAAGKRVVVPQTEVKLGRWSGSGYVIQDTLDGTGIYQIDGGLSGGVSGGCGNNAVVDSGTFTKMLAQHLEQFQAQNANDPGVRAALYAPAGPLAPAVSALAGQYQWFTAFGLAVNDFQEALATGIGLEAGEVDANASCSKICPTCGGGGGGGGPPVAGNPVSLPTGEKIQMETDYSGAGDDRLAVTRTYSTFAKDIASHIGNKWRHGYERSIHVQPATTGTDSTGAPIGGGYSIIVDTGTRAPAQVPSVPPVPAAVLAIRGDGSYFQFMLRSGNYKPNADIPEALTRQADASGKTTGWTYFNWADETEQYDAAGRLTSITSRKGMTTTLAYDAQGNLFQVRNHFGRTLTFAYNATGDIDTVTDPASGIWRYGYDSIGNLTTVTGPDLKVRRYHYEQDARTALLTGITDERGNRFATYSYDYRNRVKEETHAAGANHTTFAYSDIAATVTDALGTVRTYELVKIFETMRLAKLDLPCTVGCIGSNAKEVAYDANGFIASTTDFNGNRTLDSRDARGLELSRTEASGTALARTITTEYDPQWRVPTKRTEPTSAGSRVTTLTLDPRGNVKRKDVTVGAETRTWTYDYNRWVR